LRLFQLHKGENMNWVIIVVLGLICFIIFKFIMSMLKGRDTGISERKKYLIVLVIIIVVFGPYYLYVENNSIKDGQKYYVNLFEKENSQKNYRVPALIYIDDNRGYVLQEVYWSNGGTTSFEYHITNEGLIVGEKVLVEDDNNKKWFAELTREKAE